MIPDRKLLVDVPHGWRQVVPSKENPTRELHTVFLSSLKHLQHLMSKKLSYLMGILSPLTGAPSMISYFAIVSFS